MNDLELALWLAVCRRLPPKPKMAGIANHIARRLYLRRPRGLVEARIEGFDLSLDPTDLTEGLWLFAPQLLDREELAFLRRHLQPGATFADLGAHIGRYTLFAAHRVGPTGRVVAVEPDPRSNERLRLHLARNRLDVVVLDAAIGASSGEGTLTLGPPSNRGASSILDGEHGIQVSIQTLAEALAQAGIQQLTAAKLDLEGAEFAVLSAWLPTLTREQRPRALIVERHPARLEHGDVLELLAEHDYQVTPSGRFNVLAEQIG